MNLYFISGLGVDKRIFQKLLLPQEFLIHYVDWIQPLHKESITSYAKRLSASIDQSRPFVLVGLSFGGMIAIEMNQFIKPVKTIIISSASVYTQLPWHFRFFRFLPVSRFIPAWLIQRPNPLFYWIFGIKTPDEKILFKQILHDADLQTSRWSLQAVINWRNETVPSNLIHIHGTADKLLPIKCTKADIRVKEGEHFMVYSKANELSAILRDLMTKPDSKGYSQL